MPADPTRGSWAAHLLREAWACATAWPSRYTVALELQKLDEPAFAADDLNFLFNEAE